MKTARFFRFLMSDVDKINPTGRLLESIGTVSGVSHADLQIMKFHFDIDKSIAATAFLLQKAKGKYNILPLVKALYYANRKSFVCYGRSITGDSLCSMENGPVVSNTYNLLNDSASRRDHIKKWHQFIASRNGNSIALVKAPSFDIFSDREIKILEEAYAVVSNIKGETIKSWSHRVFPEYEEVGKSSKPIDPKTILNHEKINQSEITEIEEELNSVNEMASFLGV